MHRRIAAALVTILALLTVGVAPAAEAALPIKMMTTCKRVNTVADGWVCITTKYRQKPDSQLKKSISYKVWWSDALKVTESHDNFATSCAYKRTASVIRRGEWRKVGNGAWCAYRDTYGGRLDGPRWHNPWYSLNNR